MTTKTILAIITLCAFVYAAYLLIMRRRVRIPLPDGRPEGFFARMGWLFYLAVAIISGVLADDIQGDRPDVDCYMMSITTESQEVEKKKTFAALRTAWRVVRLVDFKTYGTDDDIKNHEQWKQAFSLAVNDAVRQNIISKKGASILRDIFNGMLEHMSANRWISTCYMPANLSLVEPGVLNAALYTRVILLREAKERGSLNEEVLRKAEAFLQAEIEIFALYNQENEQMPVDEKQIVKMIKDRKIPISESSKEAATMILRLEEIAPPVPLDTAAAQPAPDLTGLLVEEEREIEPTKPVVPATPAHGAKDGQEAAGNQ